MNLADDGGCTMRGPRREFLWSAGTTISSVICAISLGANPQRCGISVPSVPADSKTRYILQGVGREIHPVPDGDFIQAMRSLPERMGKHLSFMSRKHYEVRDFV